MGAGGVRAGKQQMNDTGEVHAEVRKEQVEIDGDVDPR